MCIPSFVFLYSVTKNTIFFISKSWHLKKLWLYWLIISNVASLTSWVMYFIFVLKAFLFVINQGVWYFQILWNVKVNLFIDLRGDMLNKAMTPSSSRLGESSRMYWGFLSGLKFRNKIRIPILKVTMKIIQTTVPLISQD